MPSSSRCSRSTDARPDPGGEGCHSHPASLLYPGTRPHTASPALSEHAGAYGITSTFRARGHIQHHQAFPDARPRTTAPSACKRRATPPSPNRPSRNTSAPACAPHATVPSPGRHRAQQSRPGLDSRHAPCGVPFCIGRRRKRCFLQFFQSFFLSLLLVRKPANNNHTYL